MINLIDVLDKNSKDISYTFLDNIHNININSSKEESFEFSTNITSTININTSSLSNCELYQKINGSDNEINIYINGSIKGYFRHVILINNKSKKINFINNSVVSENGKYEIIILDLIESDVNIINKIDVKDANSNANLMCASVVNKEYKKIIENTLTNKTNNTIATMDNYGVSFDNGTLKIRGIGSIERGCFKSVNEQKDTMFVLDENSKVSCEPFLFIDEDDVVASHANALGQIDKEALFYLCSRGIELNKAKKMVVLGYFKKFIETISSIDIKNDLYKCIEEVTSHV